MHFSRPARGALRPLVLASVALAALLAASPSAHADDATEIRQLRAELDAERAARLAMERRLKAIESTPTTPTHDEISSHVERYLGEAGHVDVDVEPAHAARHPIEASVVLSAHFGTSTATNDALPSIALGHHDPRVRGANLRNEEIALRGEITPCFTGFLDVVFMLDEEGETRVELEDAYALTTCLPCGFEAKLGQFLTEFGRVNAQHPHERDFHHVPVVLGRIFGDEGWRGQGMRLAWEGPRCATCPLTLLAGWQNARGATQAPFLGVEGEEIGEHEVQHRDVANLSDLAYHARAQVRCDGRRGCAGGSSWLAGVSAAFGPNGTGPDGTTRVLGADLTWRWRPREAHGRPCRWFAWQSEVLWREIAADDQVRSVEDGLGGRVDLPITSRKYRDWGFYSQAVYGFAPDWSIGARIDWADGDGAFAGAHWRGSVALTYEPTDHSRVRLEALYDHVEGLSRDHPGDRDGNVSVWLGIDLTLGAHGAHGF